jgi:hypothetical protein
LSKPKLLPDYKPQSIDELMWSPYYCDDCDTWHEHHVGLEIEDGEILDVSCDNDGNWEFDGTGEKATEANYERLNRELIAGAERAGKDYLAHCAETGEDPLGNFYVARTTKRKEHWQTEFTPWIGLSEHGYAITQARRGKHAYRPGELPEHVSEFLGLHKIGDRYCMEGITSADVITGADSVSPSSISFTVEKVTPRPVNVVKREIRTAAKRALNLRG